ncbi:alpha/beta hydrolase fold domain-containing protein [Jannaschia pohangensis]|uniref:Acetyl esterase/lipase n=1 Tax=Jannaschia pohangensis TaxID=390807 RepID=A0A1I3SKW4_9RHOB|nr:alpha/beta hydrolase fold domain-containing protein [Jannaschia pohangensis]SFJ59428.1 Acetyl esterase/lipase [Jannaschia pohangensis]
MSWRDDAVALTCRWLVKPAMSVPTPWWLHRRGFETFAPRPRGDGFTVTRRDLGGIPAREYAPPDPQGTLLWLHGGGFVMGSSYSYANLAAALARASGRRIILPDYRLAPEHPFPAGPDDCLAAARALIEEGPFGIGGDSAGGCFALTTLASLLADGTPPERVILASAAVDLDPARPVPPTDGELILPVSMLRRVSRDYAGQADVTDPRVSPIHADFTGAPPVLIQVGKGEILEGDSDAIAERLRAFGGEVTVQKESGVPHVWQMFAGRTPKADRAVAAMADFLR